MRSPSAHQNAAPVSSVYHAARPARALRDARQDPGQAGAKWGEQRAGAMLIGAAVLSGLGRYGIIRDGALFVMPLCAATWNRPPPRRRPDRWSPTGMTPSLPSGLRRRS